MHVMNLFLIQHQVNFNNKSIVRNDLTILQDQVDNMELIFNTAGSQGERGSVGESCSNTVTKNFVIQ